MAKGLLGIAVGIVLIGALCILRAPALIDEESRQENDRLGTELRTILDRERPRIVIRRGWVDDRAFEAQPNSSFSSLNVLFANDAEGLTEGCVARSVIAVIRFLDASGGLLCEVDAGRWGDADQPTNPRASRVPLRRVDFPIGETRELNVAIKFLADGRCYAVDNDYVATGGRKQSLQLRGETVTAEIKLLAVGVNVEWSVRFENPVNGGLRLSTEATSTTGRSGPASG